MGQGQSNSTKGELVKHSPKRDQISFVADKFKVIDSVELLHNAMKEVTKKEFTPATVNAACECVGRINETISTVVKAAKFIDER